MRPKNPSTKYVSLFFLLLTGGMVFFFSNYINTYHFFAVEQNQLFLWSNDYFRETFLQPGGFAALTGYFLQQFYLFYYVGAIITTLLTLCVWWLCFVICRRIMPQARLYFLALLPALSLTILHADFFYKTQGTIAFLLMLIALYIYVCIRNNKKRFVYSFLMVPLLLFLAGPVAFLFAVCTWIIELLAFDRRGTLKGTGIIGWSCILSGLGVYFLWFSEGASAFLPILYYEADNTPTIKLFYAWIALPALLLITPVYRLWHPNYKWITRGSYMLQALFCAGLIYCAIPASLDRENILLKKYEYHTQKQEWERIIQSAENRQNNFQRAGYLNMALAEKELLGEKAFHYDQLGLEGLIVPHSRTFASYSLLSDIYFTIGNIAMAQAMAFESNICSSHKGRPRMIQRLIETNLIYGAWPVAEKYISLLEQTLFYRKWAKERRQFLYDDDAVAGDPHLGEKRKNLPAQNHLSSPGTLRKDLYAIVTQNPGNKAAREYFLMVYLLTKDIQRFSTFLAQCYPPGSEEPLPVAFQEAALMIFANEPKLLAPYTIDPAIIQRNNAFKIFIEENKESPTVAKDIFKLFGDTYWVYYYFKGTD